MTKQSRRRNQSTYTIHISVRSMRNISSQNSHIISLFNSKTNDRSIISDPIFISVWTTEPVCHSNLQINSDKWANTTDYTKKHRRVAVCWVISRRNQPIAHVLVVMDCIEKSSTKNRWERAQELIKQNTSNAIRLFTNYKHIVINYYHSNEFSLINIYKKLRQSSFRYIIAAVLLVYVILYFNSPSTTLQSVSINTKQLFNINSSQSQSRQRRGPPYLTYIISVSTQRFNRTDRKSVV